MERGGAEGECVCTPVYVFVCLCLCVCVSWCVCVTAHVFQNCKMSTWTFKSPTYVRLRPLASLANPSPHHALPFCCPFAIHPHTHTHTYADMCLCVCTYILRPCSSSFVRRVVLLHMLPPCPQPFPFSCFPYPCFVLVAVVWLTVSQPPPCPSPSLWPPSSSTPFANMHT